MLTLQKILERTYDYLAVDSDNETYNKERRAIPKINSVMHKVLSDRKYDVIIPNSTYSPYIKGGDLEFLRDNMFFDRIKNIVAADLSNAGEYRIQILANDNVPENGWIYVTGNIIQYTKQLIEDKTYLTFETPLEMKVHRGTLIEFLYPIKDNAEETYQLFSMFQGHEVEMVYADYRYQNDYKEYRTILYKDGHKLIRIVSPEDRQHSQFKLNYYKKVENLEEDTDVSVMPDERWDAEVIAMLAAGEMLRETEQSEDAQRKLIAGYGNLILFYDKYATINKDYRQDLGWNRGMQRFNRIIN